MLTFFNDPQLKAALLARLEGHRLADEIVQREYWDYSKGCFIGCAIHGDDVLKFEREFGLSVYVARLGEYFFEALPLEKAKTLPVEIIESVPVGVDSSLVWPHFWHWLVTDTQHGLLRLPLKSNIVDLLKRVDALYATWPHVDERAARAAAWAAARAAAWEAAGAARAVAWAAAWAAGAAWEAWEAAGEARAARAENKDILLIQYNAFLQCLRGLDTKQAEPIPVPNVGSHDHTYA